MFIIHVHAGPASAVIDEPSGAEAYVCLASFHGPLRTFPTRVYTGPALAAPACYPQAWGTGCRHGDATDCGTGRRDAGRFCGGGEAQGWHSCMCACMHACLCARLHMEMLTAELMAGTLGDYVRVLRQWGRNPAHCGAGGRSTARLCGKGEALWWHSCMCACSCTCFHMETLLSAELVAEAPGDLVGELRHKGGICACVLACMLAMKWGSVAFQASYVKPQGMKHFSGPCTMLAI
eukprot:1161263-Pelagomonas_calceolata.AAC.41